VPLCRFRVKPPPRAILEIAIVAPLISFPSTHATAQGLVPSRAFVQAASGPRTDALMGGLTWDWRYKYDLGAGVVTGYWDLAVGRWRSKVEGGGSESAWVSHLGITPVFRYQPSESSDLFLELGIGANLIAPVYRSERKSFSTVFNFGDHLAVGWKFGQRRSHEIALRIQHFSNAGIKHPNPGENFLQLRYSWELN